MKQICTQHGCPYDADEPAEVCPVCNNPQGDAVSNGEAPWADYTIGELREYVTAWEVDVDGPISRVPKEALIAALEAAEAEETE